jgi:hypothetical protein
VESSQPRSDDYPRSGAAAAPAGNMRCLSLIRLIDGSQDRPGIYLEARRQRQLAMKAALGGRQFAPNDRSRAPAGLIDYTTTATTATTATTTTTTTTRRTTGRRPIERPANHGRSRAARNVPPSCRLCLVARRMESIIVRRRRRHARRSNIRTESNRGGGAGRELAYCSGRRRSAAAATPFETDENGGCRSADLLEHAARPGAAKLSRCNSHASGQVRLPPDKDRPR